MSETEKNMRAWNYEKAEDNLEYVSHIKKINVLDCNAPVRVATYSEQE